MNIFERLQKIDRRIIYLLLLVVCAVPLVRPIGLPVLISDRTRAVYDIIEELDPAKDIMLLSFDYGPGAGLDAHVVPVAVVEHLAMRGIKFVCVSFSAEGPMMADQIIKKLEERGMTYGTDFANLGYLAGEENAIRLFALDSQTITTDVRGNTVAELPIMKNVKTVKDFAFVHQFTSGDPALWIRQVVDPMGIRFAAGVVTVSVPSAMPYYNSGQMVGLLGGLRAAAEYELLIGKPGRPVAMMDAQSMAHLLIIGFIFLGNLGHFMVKRNEDKAKSA